MKRSMNTATLTIAALVLSVLAAREAGAAQLTLNLDQAQSHILLTGAFSGIPFSPQEGVTGTVDLNPALPSNDTTFQGTITVDVNNVNSPTSIQILSSAADADLSGTWLPEVEPYLDIDMDGNFGEFGDDSLTASSDPAAPPFAADWGIRVPFPPAPGNSVAYAAARDIVYNVTSPVEAVNGLGQFNSSTENFEFATGWLDYWVDPGFGNLRGRAELAGGDDDNATLLPSIYTVTPLPFNKREIKLVIPIEIDNPGGDADFYYDGQFVATLIVPEPTTFALSGMAMAFAAAFAARRRK